MPKVENSSKSETKRQKFERIAERRVNEAVRVLRLIGNLADRRNYDFSEAHVRQVLNAVDQEVRALKARFRYESAESEKQFKFGEQD